MFCKNCRKESIGNQKFCTSCGVAFSAPTNSNVEPRNQSSSPSVANIASKINTSRIIQILVVVGLISWGVYSSHDDSAIQKNNDALTAIESGNGQRGYNRGVDLRHRRSTIGPRASVSVRSTDSSFRDIDLTVSFPVLARFANASRLPDSKHIALLFLRHTSSFSSSPHNFLFALFHNHSLLSTDDTCRPGPTAWVSLFSISERLS